MAITDLYTVKTFAKLYDTSGSGAPTTATAGEVGEIRIDTATGLTYECTAIVTDPSLSYTWTAYTQYDAEITLSITEAEADYLHIRGIPFATDDNDAIVYPDASSNVAAKMVCYLLSLNGYNGYGNATENLSGRSVQYDNKIYGYPISIVGRIKRYMKTS